MKSAPWARSVCLFILFLTFEASAQSLDPADQNGLDAKVLDFPHAPDLAPIPQPDDERFAKSLDVSASGLSRAATPWPRMVPQDRELDVFVQPWEGLDLKTGMKLSEPAASAPSASLSWAFNARHPLWDAAPVSVGLATSGSLDVTGRTVSQTLAGSVAWNALSALPGPVDWHPELRLSPQMVFDGAANAWTISMVPEVVATTRLKRPGSSYQTEMSVRVGTSLSPKTTPSAAALLEIKFVPSP